MWMFKKKKTKQITPEELREIGISVVVPARIKPNRIKPNRIAPSRVELHTVKLKDDSPLVKKFGKKA